MSNELKRCPFCGGKAELKLIGNNHTKKRSAEIKCTSCHTRQVTGAIRNNVEWCERIAIELWNTRITQTTEHE